MTNKLYVGNRYLVGFYPSYTRELYDVTIVEIANKYIKVKYSNGHERWYNIDEIRIVQKLKRQ